MTREIARAVHYVLGLVEVAACVYVQTRLGWPWFWGLVGLLFLSDCRRALRRKAYPD
jgi:hypothetical protein